MKNKICQENDGKCYVSHAFFLLLFGRKGFPVSTNQGTDYWQLDFIPIVSTKINSIQALVSFSCLLLKWSPMARFNILDPLY